MRKNHGDTESRREEGQGEGGTRGKGAGGERVQGGHEIFFLLVFSVFSAPLW